MKNVFWTWGITLLCALLGIAAMSGMSRHVMRLERENHTARYEKEHAEKIRLALWRMESEASAILLLENTRSSKNFLEISTEDKPEHVRSYFQYDMNGNHLQSSPSDKEKEATLRGILSNPSNRSCGSKVSNSCVAVHTANLPWGQQITSYNSINLQKVEIQPEFEKSIRAEQRMRNLGQMKGGNIEQTIQVANEEILIAGDYRPLWMDEELFLVRKLIGANKNVMQGVWLDQSILKQRLLYLTNDLFSKAELLPTLLDNSLMTPDQPALIVSQPATDDPLALVSLPWRLEAQLSMQGTSNENSAAITALRFAWIGLAVAFVAGTALVLGLLRLSERRATFVSSVTHELRTPLTTFQLYTDLLANGMVREAEKQQTYFETMRREAIRLGHLVENVLAFAKVERGSARGGLRPVKWGEILPNIMEQMQSRLQQADLTLDAQFHESDLTKCLTTDPVALEHILLNLADNAAKYAHPHSQPKVIFHLTDGDDGWKITFRDFGPGIERTERRNIFLPFHKSAQVAANSKTGVGLGLSLSKRLAKSIKAKLSYLPAQDGGACFVIESKR